MIDCCIGCKPPRRSVEPNCHTTCPEYLKQKAKHDAALAEQHRQDAVAYGLYDRRTRAVIRANKKKHK